MRLVALLVLLCGAHGFRMQMKLGPNGQQIQSRRDALSFAAALLAFPSASVAYEKVAEPTPAWEEAEAQAAAFRKKQRELAKTFNAFFDAFTSATNEKIMQDNLQSMTKFVVQQGGLPSGITAKQVISGVRSKKADMSRAGGWETETEMAYLDLTLQMRRLSLPL
uniref:Uncharacterized protein n=1 Tax=Pinguiococcus pyrenoidosus TaxID=172671 RepID=A0A7R9U2W1_9STRA